MNPKDYLIKASADPRVTECLIGFTKSPMDFFVLGDTFMRGFYMIHSETNNLVGIVPHAGSTKSGPIFEAHPPTRPLNVIWHDYTA